MGTRLYKLIIIPCGQLKPAYMYNYNIVHDQIMDPQRLNVDQINFSSENVDCYIC